jgi:ABC-type cobalamin transport system permease subunit
MTLVALVELGHALFAGQFRMLNTIIGDVFIVLIILYTARNRNTKR